MENNIPKGPTILDKFPQGATLWNHLAERISSIWSKEKKENEPKLKVKISFSSHSTAEEVNAVEKDFKECDLYIPEGNGWSTSIEESLNDVSQGRKTPEEFKQLLIKSHFEEHRDAEFKMIYKSKKPIVFIDTPFDHPTRKAEKQNKKRYLDESPIGRNFDSYFEVLKEYLLEAGKLELERERTMVESFSSRIKSFLDENPKYRSRKELKILISLGSAHTPVFLNMRSQGIDVSREFIESSPILFDIYSEITRTATFGKNITNDMIARYILKGLTHFWFGVTVDEVPDSFFRYFSYEEIKDLFSAGIDYASKKEFKERLKILAAQKKIQIPELLQ